MDNDGPGIVIADIRRRKEMGALGLAPPPDGTAIDAALVAAPPPPVTSQINLTDLLDKQIADLEREIQEKTRELAALRQHQAAAKKSGVALAFDGRRFSIAKGNS